MLLSLAACTVEKGYEGAPKGMRPCNEGENGVIMYVPSYWNVDTSTGIPTAFYSDKDRTMISLVTVSASELAGQSVPQYWEAHKTAFAATVKDFALDKASEDASDYTTRLIAKDTCTLYEYKYSFKITGLNGGEALYRFNQAFFIHPTSGELFIVTYSAPDSVYKKHLEDLTLVYDNLRLVTETIPMVDKTEKPEFVTVEGTPDGYGAITHDHVDYILFVPTSWTPLINTGMAAARDSANPSTTCNVTVFSLEGGENYDTFFEGYEKDLAASLGAPTFSNPENKYSLKSLGGYEARNYVYSLTSNGVSYTYDQYILINGGYITMLTLCCEAEDYTANLDTFNGIASSFKFKD